MYKFTCKYCGNTFFAKNSTAKYCSAKCRVYAKRARDGRAEHERASVAAHGHATGVGIAVAANYSVPVGQMTFSEASIAREVASAHGMVSFFDSASQIGPESTREACGHIARGFERTLKEIGL
ncbi:MAG: hypothetical protein SPD98_00510 [Tractidigestivibacter sp.]|uniref:hypothetical protein n=1 Tax=Tractidigestivibacter sp. TaxID=2847320 RepID=UPI002A8080E2|nr:hypothetical protein [Tractidigestivibacter sp.]MCI6273959.1 hypothetical protein [Coriobacteriaceae bacterium]MDY4533716.1 hypothetical protein [Tractidigestivibacter sp.]